MFCTANAASAPPRAQDRAPTDGVDRLYHDYSSEGDASSLELNPAMLSAVRGIDVTLLGYRTISAYARGTGFGGFWAMNLFNTIALGLGVQGVEPRLGSPFSDHEIVDFDRVNNLPITKISFGLSGGNREYGALGVALHGVHYGGHWLQRPDFDVGTMFRIFNYGAVGFTARLAPMDLAGTDLPAEVQLAGEFAVRPLGTHHLEIAGGLKSRHFRGDLDLSSSSRAGVLPRARIAVRYHGWALKGEAEQVRAIPLGANDQPLDSDEKAWRGSVALEAAWDFVTAGGGVHAGLSDGVDGFGYMARLHTARQGRIVWPRRVDAERLALVDVKDERSMIGMLQRIERARRAGKRAVLVIDARGAEAGWASLHELREALVRVRNSGGHVFAYVETASLKDYYVASVAERIFIHPAGELDTFGMASSTLYFKSALAKLGVRVEGLAIDEYKSAHERFTRDQPSEPDRKQRTELMQDLYAQVVHDVAQGRELTLNGVRTLFDDAPREDLGGPRCDGRVRELPRHVPRGPNVGEASVHRRRIGGGDDQGWQEPDDPVPRPPVRGR
jgi:protease-4